MPKIDRVDLFILESLQADGRVTNVKLSAKAGISAPPCLRRLRSLERSGVIKGYHAEIDGRVVGYDFRAFCLVSLENQSAESVSSFVERIQGIDLIRNCSRVSGDFDFVLIVVASDFAEYDAVVSENLSKFKLIRQIKTYPVMKTEKDEKGFPINKDMIIP